MKKLLLTLVSLSLTSLSFAQWTDQATGFGTPSRGVNSINIVDANTVWVGSYDGTNTSNYITDFSKT
ncbi:MAG: glycosyl transferase, partial [Bacteroidia bacterium]|nr:glycosyl transferase [Bacteroidia bacterium]